MLRTPPRKRGRSDMERRGRTLPSFGVQAGEASFSPPPLCSTTRPRLLPRSDIKSTDTARERFVVKFKNVLLVRDSKLVRDDLWVELRKSTPPTTADSIEENAAGSKGAGLRNGNKAGVCDGIWVTGKILNPTERFWSAVKRQRLASSTGRKAHSREANLADLTIDCRGAIACAGFIDLQLNGAFGVDFSLPSCERSDIHRVSRGILAHGVTSYLPTVITSHPEVYRKVLPIIASACLEIPITRGGFLQKDGMFEYSAGANPLGMHLEGPFINPKKKGAHSEVHIRSPDSGMQSVRDVYGYLNGVRVVTLAPELPGAMAAVRGLSTMGISVAVGHTTTSLDTALAAKASGARMITHMFNAMSSFHHRDPGLMGMLTSKSDPLSNDFWYGIIVDGIHTHPAAVRMAYKTDGKGAVLVTDAMAAMGLAPGRYTLGALNVDVIAENDSSTNTPRLDEPTRLPISPVAAPREVAEASSVSLRKRATLVGTDTLAGSVVRMDECVRNYIHFTGCSVAEALESASLHPARAIGIADRKGSLHAGKDADIVFLNSNTLKVEATFVSGVPLYLSEAWGSVMESFMSM